MAPIAIAVVAVAAAAVTAYGQIKQGQAAEEAAKYNATMSRNNADAALTQAKMQEDEARRKSRGQLGQIRANYAASGVQLEGSPLDVLEMSAKNAEMDALTIRYSGDLRARGLNNEANLYEMEGRNAIESSLWAAGGTLLRGAASAAGAFGGGAAGGAAGGGGASGGISGYSGSDYGQLRSLNYA